MRKTVADPSWPGKSCAVSISFDVDAESGFTGESEAFERQLTTLSEGSFGVERGLPRIRALLAEFNILGTFYVPGDTLERHPGAIEELAAEGHEICHHGQRHYRPHRVDEETQRAELERGLATLDRLLGIRPKGYRSPAWEVTPETFEMLVELGFEYDSSFMGDDRPYIEVQGAKEILELPVHWSLDDWPYFGWHPDMGGALADPAVFRSVWIEEFASVREEGRHVTYTMHPEVIGRGYRMRALRSILEHISSHDCQFIRHDELAAQITAGEPA